WALLPNPAVAPASTPAAVIWWHSMNAGGSDLFREHESTVHNDLPKGGARQPGLAAVRPRKGMPYLNPKPSGHCSTLPLTPLTSPWWPPPPIKLFALAGSTRPPPRTLRLVRPATGSSA